MSGLRIGELCAGYGGLGMGVTAAIGGEVAWVSDIDKGANKVLAHRFANAPNLGDMTTLDWAQVEPVDVICGGTPCQDLSHAGKRAGMTEGTRSNLWVAMRDAIATIRPQLVVWENVGGAYSAGATSELEQREGLLGAGSGRPALRALGRVLGDLASLGYDAGWCGLRAADVGAAHGRLRVFVVAWPAADPHWEGFGTVGGLFALGRDADGRDHADRPRAATKPAALHSLTGALLPTPAAADAEMVKRYAGGNPSLAGALLPTPRTSDTNGAGAHGTGGIDLRTAVALLPTPAVNDMGAAYTPETWDAWTRRMKTAHGNGNGNGHGKSLNIEAQRLLPTPKTEMHTKTSQAARDKYGSGDSMGDVIAQDAWGDYAAAITRAEAVFGPAPAPTESDWAKWRSSRLRRIKSTKPVGMRGSLARWVKPPNPRLSCHFDEWLMGLPAGWITDVPDITHAETLRLCGNGVVPRQAEVAIRTVLAQRQAVAA